jgi:cell division protein YceG involved in septum cleavage
MVMNKKILVGIVIAIIIVAVGIVGIKAMLGDKVTELPYEEKVEKTLNVQEGKGTPESGESGESGEANESAP